MKKILLFGLLVVSGVLGFSKYQESQANSLIEASMRDATVRVSTHLKYMRGGHGVSYLEFLGLVDSDLKEISSRYIALKSGAIKAKPAVLKHALAYMEASQQMIRAERRVTVSLVQLNAARKQGSDAISKLEAFVADPENIRNRVRADMTDPDAIKGQITASKTEFDAATSEFQLRFQQLYELVKAREKSISKDAYLSESDMEAVTIKVK